MGLWEQIRGNAKYDLIKESVRYAGPYMIPFLYAAWLKIHDQPFDYIVLTLLAVMGAVCTLYTIRARRLQQANAPSLAANLVSTSTLGLSDRTKLEIAFHTVWPNYIIGVHNRGTHVARNVEVWLEQVHGNSYYQLKELPHRLRTKDKEKRCDINPDREEKFDFAVTGGGLPANGVQFQIFGLRLNPNAHRQAESEHMVLRLHDYLHLYIKVYCANADPQTAILYAYPIDPNTGVGIHVGRIY